MGSATVPNTKPRAMESTDRKTLKTLIKSLLFHKKKEKKEKPENPGKKENESATKQTRDEKVDPVERLLDNFNKLELEKEKLTEPKKNELDNFSFKIIEDHRSERINSQSSEDSGYSENSERLAADKTENDDKTRDIVEGLEKLSLAKDEKKKEWKTIVVSRAPIRTKPRGYASTSPYAANDNENYRQIHQINKHTLTGGQVIVNQSPDNFIEVDIACQLVGSQSQYLRDQEGYLQDVLEYIQEDTQVPVVSIPSPEYCVQDVVRPSEYADLQRKTENEFLQLIQEIQDGVPPDPQLANTSLINTDDINCIFNYVESELSNDRHVFPTPPRSENVPSPMLESPSSFYATNSEYTLSPERSPAHYSDYEKYQEIPHFEEEKIAEDSSDKKSRDRTNSISCMTMKQFKDLQKEIASEFSKNECCQENRRSCREILQEHLEKVPKEERKSLCSQIATLDVKMSYGVLQNILLSLSRGTEPEDRQHALFALLCEGILARDAKVFIGEVGLSLLKAAALRCPHRPLLTRYLVHCVRTALKSDPALYKGKECVFHEVDVLGDNLVSACARGGDAFAPVLAEIVRPHPDQPPIFRVRHANADGYTALHVACSQHSSASPRLRIVHVLLDHAGADIWKGDIKGGDTALHLAVNSANCDLRLIMLLFKHVDRKMWKALAHLQNMSSVTPIEYARSATKSTTRQNYPQEVLDFLKKCR